MPIKAIMLVDESDPITQEIRTRAIQAIEGLAPMAEIAIEQVKGSLYADALDQLAKVKDEVEHTRNLISILRDWQAENELQAIKKDEKSNKAPQENS